jgi:hypothetical protein
MTTMTTYANTYNQASYLIPLDTEDPAYVEGRNINIVNTYILRITDHQLSASVKALFETGWLHSGSALYSVNSIFGIQLPDVSVEQYLTYRQVQFRYLINHVINII